MKGIEILRRLEESGELRILVERGIMPFNVISDLKIYNAYEFRRKEVKTVQAVSDVATVFKISEDTVYRIKRKFK